MAGRLLLVEYSASTTSWVENAQQNSILTLDVLAPRGRKLGVRWILYEKAQAQRVWPAKVPNEASDLANQKAANSDAPLSLVLDNATLEPLGMSEAGDGEVIARLKEPVSKAPNKRGALSVRDFKRPATPIWPLAGP
jgi:hypothetical protein